jgi:DNA-binding response OmpR family regulator
VITDIMPEQEGFATIRQMRGERPDAKIIAMSGHAQIGHSDLLAIARKLGADDAIGKPLDADDLLSRVRQLHALPGPGGGVAA